MRDKEEYLGEGPLSGITGYISGEVVSLIGISDEETLQNIISETGSLQDVAKLEPARKAEIADMLGIPVESNGLDKKIKDEVYRRRTAEQILQDAYLTGCTDRAIAFVTLCRACGIAASYVETFSEEWVNSDNSNGIQSHAFAEVFLSGRWQVVNPSRGELEQSKTGIYGLRGKRKYLKYAEGLDPHALGDRSIKSMQELREKTDEIRATLRKEATS